MSSIVINIVLKSTLCVLDMVHTIFVLFLTQTISADFQTKFVLKLKHSGNMRSAFNTFYTEKKMLKI